MDVVQGLARLGGTNKADAAHNLLAIQAEN